MLIVTSHSCPDRKIHQSNQRIFFPMRSSQPLRHSFFFWLFLIKFQRFLQMKPYIFTFLVHFSLLNSIAAFVIQPVPSKTSYYALNLLPEQGEQLVTACNELYYKEEKRRKTDQSEDLKEKLSENYDVPLSGSRKFFQIFKMWPIN